MVANTVELFTEKEKRRVEPFVGQIILVPYNFAPKGWAFCNGQLLSIAENAVLFSLIGMTFGGDEDVLPLSIS